MFCRKKAYRAAALCLALFLSAWLLSSQLQASDEHKDLCQQINEIGETLRPYPYVWGGSAPEHGGYDCSGFIYRVHKLMGRPVPRTTARKYYLIAGGDDKHWEEAVCGDWIWWTFTPNRPFGHIGIHTERPRVWHSGSSTGPTDIFMRQSGYWDSIFESSKTP